ncbi:SOUL family heme-binding protein [Sphingomonas sp. RS6]
MANRKTWGWVGGLLGGTLVAGATAYYLFERASEQPPFTLVEKDGAFEIRDYPELIVAETRAIGTRDAALNAGFSRLADYIFAKRRGGNGGRGGDKIAMTAPVLSSEQDGSWRTQFVMPSKFTLATLPKPADNVDLARRPARRVAVLRFSGTVNDAMLASREAELRRWLAARGLQGGAAEYAFYNSPFIPGPLRRNEVMIALPAA